MQNVPSPAYLYWWAWTPIVDGSDKYGAFHAAEVPFVFGDLSAFNMLSRPEEEVFSDLMMTIWTNFAKTGNPSVVVGVFIGRFTTLKMKLQLVLGRIFPLNPAYAVNE